jgi:uncharacterized protein DUF5658
VNSNRLAVLVTMLGLSFSTATFAAEHETRLGKEQRLDAAQRIAPVMLMTPLSNYTPIVKRPAALPALYVTLGVMQAMDVYSTSAALKAGAKEANPTAAPFAGHPGSMIGLKAATMASTIFFSERLWKTNKVGAVVMMAAINGATAAVSMHNMQNARLAGRSR